MRPPKPESANSLSWGEAGGERARSSSRPRPRAGHCTREPITDRRAASKLLPQPRPPKRAGGDSSCGASPAGHRVPAFTSAARTVRSLRLPSSEKSLRDLLEMRAPEGALSSRRREMRHIPRPDLRPGLTCTNRSGKRLQRPLSSPRSLSRGGPSHTCRTTSPGARLGSSSYARYPARTSTAAGGESGGLGSEGPSRGRLPAARVPGST